jgi:hypothetical protein
MYHIFIQNCTLFQIFSYATKLAFIYLFTRSYSLSSIHNIWHSSYILLDTFNPVDGNFQSNIFSVVCSWLIFSMISIFSVSALWQNWQMALMIQYANIIINLVLWVKWLGCMILLWILSQLWMCKYCTGHYCTFNTRNTESMVILT